jgi:hypothetical protein
VTASLKRQLARPGAHVGEQTAHAVAPIAHVAAPGTSVLPTTPRAESANLCSPVHVPASLLGVAVTVGSTTIYGPDAAGNPEAIAATPSLVARASRGCVRIAPSK